MADNDNHLSAQESLRIPLNIKGAYATPPPPRGFHFDRATPEELARYGFSWVKAASYGAHGAAQPGCPEQAQVDSAETSGRSTQDPPTRLERQIGSR